MVIILAMIEAPSFLCAFKYLLNVVIQCYLNVVSYVRTSIVAMHQLSVQTDGSLFALRFCYWFFLHSMLMKRLIFIFTFLNYDKNYNRLFYNE